MRPNKIVVASTVLEPSSRPAASSSTETPAPPRVALPTDLSTSLRYLDDVELGCLREAVAIEINRRDRRQSIQCRRDCDGRNARRLSARAGGAGGDSRLG